MIYLKTKLSRIVLMLLGILLTTSVHAQNVQTQILQLNQQAMEAYINLEIDQALSLLKQAEKTCIDENLKGSSLARTYVNMGIVKFGGLGDNALAMTRFTAALCEDSKVLLDPMHSSPDMESLFKAAQIQAQKQDCTESKPVETVPVPQVETTPVPGSSVQPIINDVLRHTPVTAQRRLMPIPFFVQTNPNVKVGSVILYYRATGERIFHQLPMTKYQEGWGAVIECRVLTTLDPTHVDYYIAVQDDQSQLLSTVGSEAQPFQVAISDNVTTLAPHIPGTPPLDPCQAECPPWDRDCNRTDCGNYADLCSDAEPCCSGLACVQGVCDDALSASQWSDDSPPGMTKSAKNKVRMWLTGGTGVGFIMEDSYDNSDFPNKIARNDILVRKGFALSKLHLRLGAAYQTKNPKLQVGINSRLDLPLDSDGNYSAVVPSVLAILTYSLVGDNPENGFEMLASVGAGFVQIMHRIPFEDCHTTNEDETGCYYPNWNDQSVNDIFKRNGFRKSGPFGGELGINMIYWLSKNVGINIASIIIDATFPDFSLNIDIEAGLTFRF